MTPKCKNEKPKLPPEWKIKKLGEISHIKPPKREARNRLNPSDIVSFVPMEDLGIDQKLLEPAKERMLSEVEGSYTYFAENDVLLAKITPCFENGKLGIAKNLRNGIGFGSSEYIVFRTCDSLYNEFLYYFLSQEGFRVNGAKNMSGAVGHKRVAKDFIEQTLIPLPPLPEQKRIVAILDEVFAAIGKAKENAEKNLANARELFESYLHNVFANPGKDWEEKRLGKIIGEMLTGPFGSMLHKTDYVENGIPVVNPQNIVNGEIVQLQKTMINKETFNRLKRYALKENDIIMARRGEMGRCAVVKKENTGWLCGTGSIIIRTHKSANEYFIKLCLSSKKVKTILDDASIGTTMSNLNQGILMQVPIHLPPLNEQKQIMNKLDALSLEIKNLESVYQQKVASLDELKKSILDKAFRGEL